MAFLSLVRGFKKAIYFDIRQLPQVPLCCKHIIGSHSKPLRFMSCWSPAKVYSPYRLIKDQESLLAQGCSFNGKTKTVRIPFVLVANWSVYRWWQDSDACQEVCGPCLQRTRRRGGISELSQLALRLNCHFRPPHSR